MPPVKAQQPTVATRSYVFGAARPTDRCLLHTQSAVLTIDVPVFGAEETSADSLMPTPKLCLTAKQERAILRELRLLSGIPVAEGPCN